MRKLKKEGMGNAEKLKELFASVFVIEDVMQILMPKWGGHLRNRQHNPNILEQTGQLA